MSFRRGGAGKKRDAIEPDIIWHLKQFGCEVYQINGRALPDLLVRHRGRWVPLGIKSGPNARLTVSEREKPPSWALVCSVDEALKAVGAWKDPGLQPREVR